MRKLSRFNRIAMTVVLLCALPSSAQDINALKAAYIFYFSKFVSWERPLDNQIVVCVEKHSHAIYEQLNSLEGKSVGGSTLHIERLEVTFSGPLAERCHVYYNDSTLDEKRLDFDRVLVVSDTQDPSSIVVFSVSGGKLSFEIDARRAQAQNVKISSRLLQLAQKVYR